MTMFESVYEMNNDIQHDCNDSFAAGLGITNNDLCDIRGLLWITENSPTTQPRRVVDNRQLADNSSVLWITDNS